jgi:uncharacterized protein YjdB
MAPAFQRAAPGGPVIRDSTVVGYLIGTHGDTVARGLATFSGDSAILVLEFPLTGSSADFTLDLTAFDASGRETHHGSNQVTLRQGDNSLPPPVLVYSAPDSKIAALHVSPSSLPLNAGASGALGVSGANASGQPIGDIRVGWTSRNPAVATVDANGTVQAGAFQGSTYVVASTYTGVLDSAVVNVHAPVDHIAVNPSTATIVRGSSATVAADVRDAGNNPITDRVVTWTTSDATVATVSSAGVVHGVKIGTATITASTEGKSGTATVTVASPIDHIDLAPSSLTFASLGEKKSVTGRLVARSGASVDTLSIAYASSNPGVATVDGNGQVTATGNGNATITASSDGVSATASVSVQQVAAGISVSPKGVSVPSVGASASFAAVVRDALGVSMSNAGVTWTSSNTDVATVSSSGVATARSNGSSTITATINGKSDAGTFIVSQVPTRIAVTASSYALQVGGTSTLTATTYDANNSAIGEVPATWTTSTPALVSISGNVATALAGGTATITGSAAGFTASLTIQISGPPPSGSAASGTIINAATGATIANATISGPNGSATSNADGRFSLSGVTNGSTLSISATGFISTQYFNVQTTAGNAALGSIPLAPTSTQTGSFSGRIVDAITGLSIPNATLTARAGVNNTTGEILQQTSSDQNGNFSGTLPAGTYTVLATASGYANTVGAVPSVGGTTISNQNIVMSPSGLSNTQFRFILQWGGSPPDLDSHLVGPSGNGTNFEIAYYNRTFSQNGTVVAQLDRDVTSGFGPETITLNQTIPGHYRYYVHLYCCGTNFGSAHLTVMRGSEIAGQFAVPAQSGEVWTVLELDGTTGGITSINTVSGSYDIPGSGTPSFNRLPGTATNDAAALLQRVRAHPKRGSSAKAGRPDNF